MIKEINALYDKIKCLTKGPQVSRGEVLECLLEMCVQNKRICFAIRNVTDALSKQNINIWSKEQEASLWEHNRVYLPRKKEKPEVVIPQGWLTYQQFHEKYKGEDGRRCPSPSYLCNICNAHPVLSQNRKKFWGGKMYINEEVLAAYLKSDEAKDKYKKVGKKGRGKKEKAIE